MEKKQRKTFQNLNTILDTFSSHSRVNETKGKKKQGCL